MNARLLLLCLALSILSIGEASARRIKTDPGKPASAVSENNTAAEEIPGSARIMFDEKDCFTPAFSGYDKTLGADVETFFITNRSTRLLTGYSLDIVYLTTDGSQLHRRHVFRRCNIAPGEKIRIDIRSWDRQHSFVYYKSTKPRREATPYKVRFEPKAYFVRKN